MKKFFPFLLFSILITQAFAQKVHYKLKVGYNSSAVTINGFKPFKNEYGPNGGMTIEVPLKNFLLQAGLMYSHKGDSYISKRYEPFTNPYQLPNPYQGSEMVSRRTSRILHYLVLPAYAGYSLKDKLHFFLGPQLGYLLSAPEKVRHREVLYFHDNRKFDLSIAGTVEYKPFKNLGFYGGYDYGLSKFMKSVLSSSGNTIEYEYVGNHRTFFVGIFYQGQVITKR
jgi:hypothetical protein